MRGVELPPLLPPAEEADGPTTVLYLKERFRASPEEPGTTTHVQVCQSKVCAVCFPRA